MVVDIRPEFAPRLNRKSRSIRCWQRTARSAIAALGMPLVLAVGCTTTRPSPFAYNSSTAPSIATAAAPISQPTIAPATIQLPASAAAIPQPFNATGPADPMIRLATYAPATEPSPSPLAPTVPENQLRGKPDNRQESVPPSPPPNPLPSIPSLEAAEVLPVDLFDHVAIDQCEQSDDRFGARARGRSLCRRAPGRRRVASQSASRT